MPATFLGLDIGTSSIKALLMDEHQTVLAECSVPVSISRPYPLWSEQDPEEWWQACLTSIAHIKHMAPQGFLALHGIGLSGQQHGAVLLDADGQVLRPAILWNDGRCGKEAEELQASLPDFLERASNIATVGFTAPKVLWVRRHEPDIFKKTKTILLPKDYIRFRLSGDYKADMSDAGGTLWHNIAEREWDDALLAASGIDRSYVADLVEGSAISARLSDALSSQWGLAKGSVVIAGGAGDNAAAAVGIGAVKAGEGLLSMGTSGVLFAVTDRLLTNPARVLNAMCHALPHRWHVMGVSLSAASALSWFADVIGKGDRVGDLIGEVQAFASNAVERANAPIFVPYLTGERTPHNDPEANGLFAGLRAQHNHVAMAYAVMEGVAFCFADDFDVLADSGVELESCFLVGGGARSMFWGQMLADVIQFPLDLLAGAETGAALGAVRLGMLAANVAGESDICFKPDIKLRYQPNETEKTFYHPRLDRFRALYEAERRMRTR
jgi:xylulokinase